MLRSRARSVALSAEDPGPGEVEPRRIGESPGMGSEELPGAGQVARRLERGRAVEHDGRVGGIRRGGLLELLRRGRPPGRHVQERAGAQRGGEARRERKRRRGVPGGARGVLPEKARFYQRVMLIWVAVFLGVLYSAGRIARLLQ